MQVVKLTSSMSTLVKRGQLSRLPTELRSQTLQDIVAVFRGEIVRILKSLAATKNVDIRRLLMQLGIVDTETESTGQPTLVVSFLYR